MPEQSRHFDIPISDVFLPLFGKEYRHFALFGGRGAGKSHAIALAILAHAARRYERVVCVRATEQGVRLACHNILASMIMKFGLLGDFEVRQRDISCRSTGSRFTFLGLERNPDVIRSLEGCTILWAEEAQELGDYTIETVLPTIRHPDARFYWSWNPKSRNDPIDALFRKDQPPADSYVRRVSWRDNPFFTQSPNLVADYARLARVNPDRVLHVYEGEYDESSHVMIFPNVRYGPASEVPDKAHISFGLDFGFADDPTVMVKIAWDQQMSRIWILGEKVLRRAALEALPAMLGDLAGTGKLPIIADPSNPAMIKYLARHGLNVLPARRGGESVNAGIMWLQGQEIIVTDRSFLSWKELSSYRWSQDRVGNIINQPAPKQSDHAIDALRYAIEPFSFGNARAGRVYMI